MDARMPVLSDADVQQVATVGVCASYTLPSTVLISDPLHR